jgi:phosphoesterase RecJ-like protein
VSWRSQPDFDVSEVALNFGGGGHAAAAGASIKGDLKDIQANVLVITKSILEL